MASFPGACGRGCAPVPPFLYGGEDCLSEASSAAHTTGTWAQAPGGPRPGADGFGSFCRNKRTSSCGGETPHEKLCYVVLCFAMFLLCLAMIPAMLAMLCYISCYVCYVFAMFREGQVLRSGL